MPVYQLLEDSYAFPPVEEALDDPQGLLAVGGDLSVPRLLNAYQQGIFPWYSEDEPILWWAPSPRMVLQPQQVHISKSMAKLIRQQRFQITYDSAFERVIVHCANTPRPQQADAEATWIIDEMQEAYTDLFHAGYAHSIEVWDGAELVGGLYGVAIGKMFFGESMFSLRPNVSKLAFIALAQVLKGWDFSLIDCQLPTDHLASLGAKPISMEDFQQYLWHNNQLGLCSYWGQDTNHG
jgi:leucyl/phenylalanyl-tRNA--protein transferase